MSPDSTLEAAVKKLLLTMPGLLPENKRVLGGTLSDDTGAYSKARTRLPREAVVWLPGRSVGRSSKLRRRRIETGGCS